MKLWASLLTAMIIAMTPAAMEAFSTITGAQILSGTIDLRSDDQFIEAVGKKDGITYQINCHWLAGRPEWIHFIQLESEL